VVLAARTHQLCSSHLQHGEERFKGFSFFFFFLLFSSYIRREATQHRTSHSFLHTTGRRQRPQKLKILYIGLVYIFFIPLEAKATRKSCASAHKSGAVNSFTRSVTIGCKTMSGVK
jgi:hypothetical protein